MKWLQKLLEPQVKPFTGKSTPSRLFGKTQDQLDSEYSLSALGISPETLSIKTSAAPGPVPAQGYGTNVLIDGNQFFGVTKIEIVLDASSINKLIIHRNCRDNPFTQVELFKITEEDIASVVEAYSFSGEINLSNLVELQKKLKLDESVWEGLDELINKRAPVHAND